MIAGTHFEGSPMKAKITKSAVDRVTPAEHDTFLWDPEVRGFGLKVTPAGSRIYILQYRCDGSKLRRYTIGRHGSPWTPEQARQEAKRLLGMIANGVDPADHRAHRKVAPTMAELAKRFLAEHVEYKTKPRTAKEYRRVLHRDILPVLGERRVADVTRAEIQTLHLSLGDTPSQGNYAIRLLSTMFNWAESQGILADGSNPCRHVQKYRENKKERFLSESELARLGRTLNKFEREGGASQSVIAAIRLLILTGARLSEILTLQWDFVDFERTVLRLPESKTGAKTIYLNPPAVELLAELPRIENNPYVIPGQKDGARLINLGKPWRLIRTEAKLNDVRLHDLRHSFASVGAAAGLSLPVIGALLGHSQAATTQRYAHLADDPLREAIDLIGQKVAPALKPSKSVTPR